MYRSYPITVSMNVPYATIVVTVNENLKTMVQPWNTPHPHLFYFLCAGIAGGIAGLLTNPLDVVKTRLQTQELKPSCPKLREMWDIKSDALPTKSDHLKILDCKPECEFEVKKIQYRDFVSTIKLVYKREGYHAFTRGMGPRMCINVPSTALSWGTYEIIKNFLTNRWKE